MDNIIQIIENNQDEFNQMVVDFIMEKTTEKETKQKSAKTICHFKALGETFNSNKFVDNYEKFLLHISALPLSEEVYHKSLGTFVTDDVSNFPPSIKRNDIIYLPNNLKVSTYSSTNKKMEHVAKIGDELGLHIDFKIM